MSMTDQAEIDMLDHMFIDAAAVHYGDDAGLLAPAAEGVIGIGLYTVTLTDTSTTMATNEAAYSGYVRQTEARNATQWTSSGTTATATNDNAITYPVGASSETETDFALGFNNGTGTFMHIYGALTDPLDVNTGITPEFAAGALDIILT